MSKILASHKVVCVDCDDTLILWDYSAYLDLEPVVVEYAGDQTQVRVHQKNINLLRKLYKLGYQIVVWSQTGYDWAQAVAKAVGIDDKVSLYMSKPRYHIDDLPSHIWMGERLYRDPVTGKSLPED